MEYVTSTLLRASPAISFTAHTLPSVRSYYQLFFYRLGNSQRGSVTCPQHTAELELKLRSTSFRSGGWRWGVLSCMTVGNVEMALVVTMTGGGREIGTGDVRCQAQSNPTNKNCLAPSTISYIRDYVSIFAQFLLKPEYSRSSPVGSLRGDCLTKSSPKSYSLF